MNVLLHFISLWAIPLYGRQSKQGISITHLIDNFYVYTTWQPINNAPFPSNSMYLVTDTGVVMFDTPWDSTQFQPLLDSIDARHHKKVILCIATHFHDDRTAGIGFLKSKGIPTYSSQLTYNLCKAKDEKQTQFFFSNDTVFHIGCYSFDIYYAGPGHTVDNIVIWFDKYKILYGGCLIKSNQAKNLGNIADANTTAWPVTIRKIIARFPHPKYIIPGHFGWTNGNALKHTLELLHKYARTRKSL